jgi:cysteine desulfuration protein SufE
MQERENAASRYGSPNLDTLVQRLSSTGDPRKRYEYVLWLAKKLPEMPKALQTEDRKVPGCVSQVFVDAHLDNGVVHWQGASDALITKGLLALLIQGLRDLTPEQVQAVDPAFIAATGLQASLTPSRANGFLNILRMMQAQAAQLSRSSDPTAA